MLHTSRNITAAITALLVLTACGDTTLIEEHVVVRSHDDLAKLHGITAIQGNLSVMVDGVESLAPLSELIHVEGDLIISRTDSLIDLSGLENLVSVSGRITIGMNDSLKNLAGLDNLQEAGELWINGNPELETIGGLSALKVILDDFVLWQNPVLENLNGLSKLEYVGGDLKVCENTQAYLAR